MTRTVLPIAVIVGIFLLWELYGRTKGFNPLFFSYPSKIWEGLKDYAAGDMLSDLAMSGREYGVGMSIAIVSGIGVGLAVGSSKKLSYAVDPLIDALYATPTIVLTPLFIIWFGIGAESKTAMCAMIAFFPLAINIIRGVSTVDPVLIEAAKAFGGKRRQIQTDVILPGILPFLVVGLRLSIRSGVVGIVIAEFLGGLGGVGYRVNVFASQFQTGRYLAAIGILVSFSVIMNMLIKSVERRLAVWRPE